jgi:hypothetical protein
MDWFRRYGIPGTIFYIQSFLFSAFLYPCEVYIIDFKSFVPLGFLTIIPIGYIIVIIQQYIYLNTKSLGLYRRAFEKDGNSIPEFKEKEIEPRVVNFFLNKVSKVNTNREVNENFRRHVREWVLPRMDVLVINFAILIASGLSFLIVLFFPLLHLNWKIQIQPRNILFLIVFALIIAAAWLNYLTIRGQIVDVLSNNFKQYNVQID